MAETDQDEPPWLKSRQDGGKRYWRWECPKCGTTGMENSSRDGAIHGHISHVRKRHKDQALPDPSL